MLDNPLITLVISLINNALNGPIYLTQALETESGEIIEAENGQPIAIESGYLPLLGPVIVQQSNQPTKQGVPSGPTVFLTKISDRRYGWVNRVSAWNADTGTFVHTETQAYETTFQISALAIQDPSNVNAVTASDLCNTVAAILQSSYTVWQLQQNGIGIERITDVRNPVFQDDKQQNEFVPSFDFTLTHKQVIVSSVPKLDPIGGAIYPI